MREPFAMLGGTFDPVHYGHLRLAEDVRKGLALDEIRLVPAGDPRHRAPPHASARDRLAMLELAVREFPGLRVDDREIRRQGPSYTVLTLEELRKELPGRPLLLVVGADSFRGLPQWHRWRDLFDLAHLVVVERPGDPFVAALPAELREQWVARRTDDRSRLASQPSGLIYQQVIAPHPISSSAIRSALARGPEGRASVEALLPGSVLAYIDLNRLYQTA